MKTPDLSDSKIRNPAKFVSYERSGNILSLKYAAQELGDVEYLGNGQFRVKRFVARVPAWDFEKESDAVSWILEGIA